jgi:hypothetical protein
MDRFFLRAASTFALTQALAVIFHFCGPSPFGGPLFEEPMRFIPEAILANVGVVGWLALLFAGFETLVGGKPVRESTSIRIRQAFVVAMIAYTIGNQLDLEIVRWLGQHVNVSFIRNFFGVKDRHLLSRILASDIGPTSVAFSFICANVAAGIVWLRRSRSPVIRLGWQPVLAVAVASATFLGMAWGMRYSEKRWVRVRPAIVGIAHDVWQDLSGANHPVDRTQAMLDLQSFVRTGKLAEPAGANANEVVDFTYPLVSEANPHLPSPAAFAELPRASRPNVVFIVFETLRGWKTGLVGEPEQPLTPEMDTFLRREAIYFPWVHSNGYPSVEGCMSLHLGLWPDFQRIIFADFVHLRTRSWPEILREAGYHTFALLGADPSFSSFTPWMRRWYDEHEYRPENRHDGPLVDRFIEKYDELTAKAGEPIAMTLWTATTHPPYDVPQSEGIAIAATSEERYDQAINYSQRHVMRLVNYLRGRPDWDNTIVFLVGDHSQPTPYQRSNPESVCQLSPGHTWTSLAVFGGWPGLPKPGPRAEMLSHVDIAPTLLGLLGVSAEHHFVGRDASKFRARDSLREAIEDDGEERPALAFRNGEAVWHTKHQRICFSPLNAIVQVSALDPSSREHFGLLSEASQDDAPAPLPVEIDVERYRDLIRAYSTLISEDRIMPP